MLPALPNPTKTLFASPTAPIPALRKQCFGWVKISKAPATYGRGDFSHQFTKSALEHFCHLSDVLVRAKWLDSEILIPALSNWAF